MYKQHSFFKSINDEDKIWRYMDFSKFMDLLENRSLFFCRADKFKDKFEGSYSKFNQQVRPIVYSGINPNEYDSYIKRHQFFAQYSTKNTYISCWHINEVESDAMWDLYCQCKESIAIQTTFSNLKRCFNNTDKDVYIGTVNYVDYNSSWIPEGNSFSPFLYKRLNFSHENELRAIIQEYTVIDDVIVPNQPLFDYGLNVSIDMDELIQNIYVSPLAPEWFFNLIKSIIDRYEIHANVLHSTLSETPVY